MSSRRHHPGRCCAKTTNDSGVAHCSNSRRPNRLTCTSHMQYERFIQCQLEEQDTDTCYQVMQLKKDWMAPLCECEVELASDGEYDVKDSTRQRRPSTSWSPTPSTSPSKVSFESLRRAATLLRRRRGLTAEDSNETESVQRRPTQPLSVLARGGDRQLSHQHLDETDDGEDKKMTVRG